MSADISLTLKTTEEMKYHPTRESYNRWHKNKILVIRDLEENAVLDGHTER